MTRPLLLVVLDGWGYRAESDSNAVLGNAPYFHELLARYPHALLTACGEEVGLPLGIMGNSEVGHMNLGSGRVVSQDISRINKAIEDGEFASCGAFTQLLGRLVREGRSLHLIGLVSDGGVHSSNDHLRELLRLAAAQGMPAESVFVHALTDGRDTPPRSGAGHMARLEQDIQEAGVGRVASIVGRYWGMDRDKRWERVARAYHLWVCGQGRRCDSSAQAMSESYADDVTDEFLEPTVLGDPTRGRIADDDGVIIFNFRSDRVRQFCDALHQREFTGFDRESTVQAEIVTMTQYRADFPFAVAFPPTEVHGIFPELVSTAGLRQKRIAETEKYAHVTFFFSGGEEAPFPGEERILVPSPRVATYDLQPEMNAQGVTDAIMGSLEADETEVYVVNFANADMVGHTGIYSAAAKAVAVIDRCLQTIVPAVVGRGGTIAITADHGNSEQLWDPATDQPHTAHTLNPVPIVFCAEDLVGARLRERGILADVAPTLLQILGLETSAGMNGSSLLS